MSAAYSVYKKIIGVMNKVLDVVTVILMLGMVFVVSYQVIMRQIFENPPIWGEEISVTLMVWFVFLGIVLGLEENLHIGITMFVAKLPKKAMFVTEILVNVLILGLAALFIYYGFSFAQRMFTLGTSLTATGMPAGIHYAVVPIAGVLMALVALGKIAGQIIERKGLTT